MRSSYLLFLTIVFAKIGNARAEDGPADEAPPPRRIHPLVAAGIWTAAQLVPSPLFVAGSRGVGGGLRWQITPLVYAFGLTEKRLRFFVVEPVARHAGAIEIFGSPEWACCDPDGGSGWIGRAGARVYLPIVGRGGALSASLGGSYYYENRRSGPSLEIGAHTLSSVVGMTVTLSPLLLGREGIVALTFRYF